MVLPLILRKPPSVPLNSTWKVFTHLEGEEPVRPVKTPPPPPSNLLGLHGGVRPHQQNLTSGNPDETQPASLMADRNGRHVTRSLLSGGGCSAASFPVLPAAPHLTRCGIGPSAHVDEEDGGQRQPDLQSQSATRWSLIGPVELRLLGFEEVCQRW